MTPGIYHEQFTMAVEDTTWVEGGVVDMTITVVASGDAAAVSAPQVGAKAYLVMDAETGEVLMEKDADEVRSIASLSKLMTSMVVLQDVRVDPYVPVTLLGEDEVGGARLRVSTGTVWSLSNILASTLIGSTNNTAHALARVADTSVASFVGKMNARATALGLQKTRFVDPTGIEVENVSTAREVALMALNAFNDPTIRALTASATYQVWTVDGTGYRTISNTNGLVNDPSLEVVAGKTGYLIEAGWTLATQVKREGERELMVVVLGCDDRWASFSDARNLANWAWNTH
jgi:D-alanyl-D-alanine endopeptidase (penicillin-binding protein 7)